MKVGELAEAWHLMSTVVKRDSKEMVVKRKESGEWDDGLERKMGNGFRWTGWVFRSGDGDEGRLMQRSGRMEIEREVQHGSWKQVLGE